MRVRHASLASWLSLCLLLCCLCLAHVSLHTAAADAQDAQTQTITVTRSSKVATLNPYRFARMTLKQRAGARAASAASAHAAAELALASQLRAEAAAALRAELEASDPPSGGGALNPVGGPTGSAPPAPAPAPATTPPAIHITSVLKDPITNMLESKWAVVFLVFIILIILCVVAYCFREHVAACVACLETVCYHTVKTLMIPFKLLMHCAKTIAYPIKQAFLACKDRMDRYWYPAEMRVSGLRY